MKRQAGSALLVGVMAFLFLGLSLLAGLGYFAPRADLGRQRAVSVQMTDTVQKALWTFVSRNYRLPCPADGSNVDPTSSTFGEEVTSGSACTLTTPAAGIIPWKTLGLTQAAVRDGWGNMLGYAVTPALAAPNATPYKTSIPKTDAVEVSVPVGNNTYAYVIMSFGPDAGGYNLAGIQSPTSSLSRFTSAEIANESNNRTALSQGGVGATPFVSPAATGGAIGGQWLIFENSAQICNDVNGRTTGGTKFYCTKSVPQNGLCGSSGLCNPLSMANSLKVTTSGQTNSNPNGVSSSAVLLSSGLATPVLVLGTNSSTPSINSAPVLNGSSQACSWATIPLPLTTQTLRAYFEFSTVDATPGDGFVFSLLPASTDITSSTPCGGTPGGQGSNSGTTNEGSYLGFEAIVDGGASGSATATPTVTLPNGQTTGPVTSIAVNANGAGYLWVPPVEITDPTASGTPISPGTATAYVSQTTLNTVSVTNPGYGYIAAEGASPIPTVTVGPAVGAGYPNSSIPTVTIETAAATGCLAPSTCTNATGTATVSGGQVSLTLGSPGSGYVRAPAVWITGAVDSGCVAGCADAITATSTIMGSATGGPVTGLFLSGTCSGCANFPPYVNSMAITGVELTNAGSLYLLAPGGSGYSGTPSVLIFNNNAGSATAGQGATATATYDSGSGAVTGVQLTSGGSGYSGASVVVAGGGIAYVTIGTINNGIISNLNWVGQSGAGYTSVVNGSFSFPLPAPLACSGVCTAGTGMAYTDANGHITGAIVVDGGAGYSSLVDTGNYAPITDSAHQVAVVTATVSGGVVAGLTLASGYTPQIPTVTVNKANGETGTIVPASLSATVDANGVLSGLYINSVGSGYTLVPTITITPPSTCSTCAATGKVTSMGVVSVKVPTTFAGVITGMPSIGIAPPTGCVVNPCYAATAVANVKIAAIAMSNQGSGYSASTIATLPPPNVLPKLGIEFRTYHHPNDPNYDDYLYHDDWGFFGNSSNASNASLLSALVAQQSYQHPSKTGIALPQDYYTNNGTKTPAQNMTQSLGGNIRHDDNNSSLCDGSGCGPQYMSALLVDTLFHDVTYHYSTVTSAGLDNSAYTVSPSCDLTQGNNLAQHAGGFVAGGYGVRGALASASAPAVGGCSYDSAGSTPIITNPGPIADTQNNSGVNYHPVRVEIRRYCDPTCSSCGNQGTQGYNYIQVAAYLDCDSLALGGAACSDMTQNLLVPGSQVFSIIVTNNGSGYTSAPTVDVEPANGDAGSGATATATFDSNTQAIKVKVTTRGSGYSTPPIVILSGGGGTGATAVASISGLPLPDANTYTGSNIYALNYCTVDPGSTNWTSAHKGLSSLDNILTGFTVGAGGATRGVLIRNLEVGTY